MPKTETPYGNQWEFAFAEHMKQAKKWATAKRKKREEEAAKVEE